MVFLTGASGLVGGHLLIHLLKKGERVRALRRTSSSFDELKLICHHYQTDFEQVMNLTEWVTGDILQPDSLNTVLSGVETVYHCAAIVSFGNASSELLERINIEGTRNLTELAIKANISCFAFVSSIGALGQSQKEHEFIDEDTPWNSNNTSSIYSNSKHAAEEEVWSAAKKGLNVVIVNPGIILGAGDFEKGSLQFFSQVKKGMPFYTPQQSGYVDVRDVCKAIIMLVEQKKYNRRYVLVSRNLTNKELFTMIAKVMDKRPPFIEVGSNLLKMAALLNRFVSSISGKAPLLTPEIVRSALKKEQYSSQRIIHELDFNFVPMQQCIEEILSSRQ